MPVTGAMSQCPAVSLVCLHAGSAVPGEYLASFVASLWRTSIVACVDCDQMSLSTWTNCCCWYRESGLAIQWLFLYQVRALLCIVYFSPDLLTWGDKSRAQALCSATQFQEFYKDAAWYFPSRDRHQGSVENIQVEALPENWSSSQGYLK